MRFVFIAKHPGIWPVSWICEALGAARSSFQAWPVWAPSARSRSDAGLVTKVRTEAAEARKKDYVIWDDGLPGFGFLVFGRLMSYA